MGRGLTPHNLDAERSVLGGMLIDPEHVETARAIVAPDDFYRMAHQTVYAAILALIDRKVRPDTVTLSDTLQQAGTLEEVGGRAYVASLIDGVPFSVNVPHYARVVKEHALRRKLIEAAKQLEHAAHQTDATVEELIDAAESQLTTIGSQQTSDLAGGATLASEATKWLEDVAERRSRGRMSGLTTGISELDAMTDGLQPGELTVIGARPSQGKALALDTPIPTPDGWRTMADIRVGDLVFDECGCPCAVTYVSPIYIGNTCYEVGFSDGTKVVADGDHQWFAYDLSAWKSHRERRYRAAGGYSCNPNRNANLARSQADRLKHPRVVTTRDMLGEGLQKHGRANWMIPVASALDLPHVALAVDPYVMGCWLGDGCTSNSSMTIGDQDVAHFQAEFASAGYRLAPLKPKYAFSTSPVAGVGNWQSYTGPNRHLAMELKSLGLMAGEKFIPAVYLRASIPQRLALLQGLMDTDGHASPRAGCVELILMNRALLEQVRDLVCSLGQRPRRIAAKPVTLPDGRVLTAWRLAWTPRDIVFRMKRKDENQPQARVQRFFGKKAMRSVTAIREVASVAVRCISVDSPARLYLATESMIPTHNTALALQMALGCEAPCAFFSLEMKRAQLSARALALLARVDGWGLRTGRLLHEEYLRVSQALTKLAESGLAIDDAADLSIWQIRSKARRWQSQHGLSLIVVDYLQLVTPSRDRRKQSTREQEVATMSRAFKGLAKDLNVPVIVLAQLNRQVEARAEAAPKLSDLRESGAVEQDADLVILLHRPSGKSVKDEGEAHLIIAKQRNGPTGTVQTWWVPRETAFRPMPLHEASA
jgi:replicative DNA helicase